MTTRFAYFIGGPLDGQRHIVDRFQSHHTALHAEMAGLRTPRGSAAEVGPMVARSVYWMPLRPVNPKRDHPPGGWRTAYVTDAEIGVYYFIGGEPC